MDKSSTHQHHRDIFVLLYRYNFGCFNFIEKRQNKKYAFQKNTYNMNILDLTQVCSSTCTLIILWHLQRVQSDFMGTNAHRRASHFVETIEHAIMLMGCAFMAVKMDITLPPTTSVQLVSNKRIPSLLWRYTLWWYANLDV